MSNNYRYTYRNSCFINAHETETGKNGNRFKRFPLDCIQKDTFQLRNQREKASRPFFSSKEKSISQSQVKYIYIYERKQSAVIKFAVRQLNGKLHNFERAKVEHEQRETSESVRTVIKMIVEQAVGKNSIAFFRSFLYTQFCSVLKHLN